jgi:hypothetical protein
VVLRLALHAECGLKGSSDAQRKGEIHAEGFFNHCPGAYPYGMIGTRGGRYESLPIADEKALSLQRRLVDADKDKARLFTFLKYPHLPSTHHQAERSLRGMVIFRKIRISTRSHEGPYTHSVLPGLRPRAQRRKQRWSTIL